jgi:hypothetical protein
MMGTRRDFLQLGIAATALPLTGANLSSSMSTPPVMPFYKIVFDERFPDSVAFARQMQRLGATVHGITGDITDFWFNELHARWAKRPVAVAGLTLHGPLFCLERLAWDHRMRVVYRADHRLRSDGRMEHALSGPERMLKGAAELIGGESDWGLHAANVVNRCPQACSQMTETTIIAALPKSSTRGERHEDEQDPLISWVIAPVVRV